MTKQKDLILACEEAAKNDKLKTNPIFHSIVKLSQMKMSNNEIQECIKEVELLTKEYK